jgi:hypothetical protein
MSQLKRRLYLAGHVIRISDYRTVKKVFLGEPNRRIRSSKRKLSFLDCIEIYMKSVGVKKWAEERSLWTTIVKEAILILSNLIFLPTAYSPALICFGRWRGWWITCNYPTVLKEKIVEKQKEYNLRYLLAKVRTTWEKTSDRLRQRANKRNKKPGRTSSDIGAELENHTVGRGPTQDWKVLNCNVTMPMKKKMINFANSKHLMSKCSQGWWL